MNVTEAIDQVLERTDNIKGSPADYLDRRQRLLEYLREVFAEVWWLRDWPWKLQRAPLTVLAGLASVNAPLDFASFGNSGGVYLVTTSGGDGYRLNLVTESEILDTRERSQTTNTPTKFAVFGWDTGAGVQKLQFPPNLGDVSIAVWYQPNPPDLDEAGNVDNLKRIPEKYHQLVLIPGLRSKSRESKSDDRWKNSYAQFESGKRWMLTEEARYQGRERGLPSFFGDRARAW